MPAQEHLTQLRNILDEYFDEEELRTLCFVLGVQYDNLGGRSKADKARELVDLMNRNGRLAELVAEGRERRPNAPWPPLEENDHGERGGPRFPIDNIPFHRNLTFTGRKEHLQALEQALQQPPDQPTNPSEASGQAQPTPQPTIFVLAGLGGVGKTQLALEYCYRHQDDYEVMWWLRADETATVAARLMRRALAIYEARLGAQHPDTEKARESLAVIEGAMEERQ